MTWDIIGDYKRNIFYGTMLVAVMALQPLCADVLLNPRAVHPDKKSAKLSRRLDENIVPIVKTKKDLSALSAQFSFPAEKLERGLLKLWSAAGTAGVQSAIAQMGNKISFAENGEDVVVILNLEQGADLRLVENSLKKIGASPVLAGTETIKAVASIDLLDDIASLSGVGRVRSLLKPRHKSNSVLSEGVAATLADSWHSAGHTGLGVKVAVIDSAFANLSALKSAGEIPENVIEYNLSSSAMTSGSYSHGCACAEIVYDMAPDAQLYLIKIEDVTDLIPAESYCEAQGIDVVSFSLGYDALNFHDGTARNTWYTTVANHPVTAVNRAESAGIFWATAAGNEQYQHTLIDWRDRDNDGWLDWDDSFSNLNFLWLDGSDVIPAGTEMYILLTWNHWPLTNSDFDLYLYRNTGSGWDYCESGQIYQTGDSTSYPYEEVYFQAPVTGYYAVLIASEGTVSPAKFILRYYGVTEPDFFSYGEMYNPPPGSICIPADAASVFTVGALDYESYLSGSIEWFSSLGPNNRAYTGGSAVIKPDICGPDRNSSVTYSDGFAGTSAATPHIAGLAALIKSAYPDYTQSQIKQYIETNACDLGTAGTDNTYGAGAARLGTAPEIPPIVQSAPVLGAGGKAVLQWTSFANRTYDIYWTSNLLEEFTLIHSAVQATPPMNIYTDNVSGASSSFWKIESN